MCRLCVVLVYTLKMQMKKINAILLVDDDEATNYISSFVIKRAGIADELFVAQNGKEALELLQERCASETATLPQLVLLDINMPVMDGFKFLELWQAVDCPERASVKVAVLSTSLDPRDLERVKGFGVKEFLNKPLTKEKLHRLYTTYFEQGQVTAR